MSHQPKPLFLEACGLAKPLELLVAHVEKVGSNRATFEQPFVLVGRDPSNDLCLEDDRVSRRHAYLQVIAGRLFCLDLDSRTGLHWEGGQGPTCWLSPSAAVRIGPFWIRLINGGIPRAEPWLSWAPEGDGNPLETRLPDSPLWPQPTLYVLNNQKLVSRCRLSRVLTLLGRSHPCRVRFSGAEEMPHYHCALLRTPWGLWGIALDMKERLCVNGQRVSWARLEDSDELKVGKAELRVTCPSPKGALPASGLFSVPPSLAGGGFLAICRPETASNLAASTAPMALQPDRAALEALCFNPVAQQLGAIRQEMSDQFQQTVLLLAQMFTSLHENKMELVREEIDQLRTLTQELAQLKEHLAASAKPAPEEVAPEHVNRARNIQDLVGSSQGESTRLDDPAMPAATGASPVRADNKHAQPAEPEGEKSHLWLNERILALQRERESRWQKILHFVTGD